MKIKQLFILIILTVTLGLGASAQAILDNIIKNGEIRVGMSGNQPPFSMKAKDGTIIGYEVDLATMLASSIGVELKIVEMPFPKLLEGLENGYVDAVMSGMTITPERNLKAAFIGPYMLSGKSILTKSSVLARISSAEEANKAEFKFTCLKGSTSESFVRAFIPEAELILVDNYDMGVDMVLNDKADALVADYPICLVTMLRNPDKGLAMTDEPLTIEPIGMAIPANDMLYMNMIENYFASMQLAGLLDLLEMKWFDDGTWLLQIK